MKPSQFEVSEILYAVMHGALWVVLWGAVSASVVLPLGAMVAGTAVV